jgi:hypothetical protein
MGTIIISLLLSFSLAATAPIQSKEEIQYVSKAENKLIDTFKANDFVGIIGRPNEKNQDLAMVDLYVFKETNKIAMTEKICKEFLGDIFGNLNKSTLKVTKVDVYTSHTGKTCEARIEDPDKASKIPERRTIIGFLNAKPYGLVFQLSKKSDSAVQENTRKFWDSLR